VKVIRVGMAFIRQSFDLIAAFAASTYTVLEASLLLG
jgi:hypothetical protein